MLPDTQIAEGVLAHMLRRRVQTQWNIDGNIVHTEVMANPKDDEDAYPYKGAYIWIKSDDERFEGLAPLVYQDEDQATMAALQAAMSAIREGEQEK